VFCHLSDFLIRKGIGNLRDNPIDEINYGQLVRAIVERSAKWIAEVQIDSCEGARASEMAKFAVDVALVGVQLVIPWNRRARRLVWRGHRARNFLGTGNKQARRQVSSVATEQNRGGWRRKHVRQQAACKLLLQITKKNGDVVCENGAVSWAELLDGHSQ
jgi:hypothetical protein